MAKPSLQQTSLPPAIINRITAPLTRFMHVASASGIVLLVVTVIALVLANSPAASAYLSFWRTPIGFNVGSFEMQHSLKHWINDGLMVIFFFVIGLEVKRELVIGELRDLRAATLPIAAALGGMVVPALFYLALQWGGPNERGWGIPMATDIAFVVGCLAVLGSRVPRSLRVMLLSLAIADDIGAILVIAIGYSKDLNLTALGWGGVGIGLVVLLERVGVRSILVYVVLGIGIWLGFHESGVHATIAGVILGLLTPTRAWVSDTMLATYVERLGDFLQGDSMPAEERKPVVRTMEVAARETISPVERLEETLHPWVGFVIMPLFALANAGVPLTLSAAADSVALAVALGLVIGKPLGITLFSWLAIRAGLAKLPEGVSWGVLAAGSVLAGIGFTMSLFIAELALQGGALAAAKIGVLTGSAICAASGMLLLIVLISRDRVAKDG